MLIVLHPSLYAADRVPADFVAKQTPRPLPVNGRHISGTRVSARWAETETRQVDPGLNAWRLRFQDGARPAKVTSSAKSTDGDGSYRVRLSDFTEPTSEQQADVIRLTSQLERIDPFDDPFGDQSPEPIPPPAASVPPAEFEVPTAVTAQPGGQLNGQRDDDVAPLPTLGSQDAVADPDCDRIYNQRNCCVTEAACKTAQEYIRNASVRDISIDITPQLTVARMASEGSDSYDQERRQNLAAAPTRRWKNERNEVVAEGRLTDFRDSRVVIRRTDGTTVRIPFDELSDDDMCFVTAWWNIPPECSMGDEAFAGRNWVATTLTWKASALCNKPLYFEEVQLERYGHTAGPFVQPIASSAHFFLNVATLPYQMAINPPNECQYALGYYRPGDCAPWLLPPIPLSIRGALAQAGVVAGGVFIIP